MENDKQKGQLIVTLHDLNLMTNEIWRTDEIWFTENVKTVQLIYIRSISSPHALIRIYKKGIFKENMELFR